MLARTAISIASVTAALVAASAAQAAYLTLGTSNTSSAPTTLTGSANGPELKVINTSGAPALVGQTPGTNGNAFGVVGTLTSSSPGADSAAVRGQNNATNSRGSGVWGSHAGSGVGVRGQSLAGRGVLGVHTGQYFASAGVEGDTSSETRDAAGVFGHVTTPNPSSLSAGVYGLNQGASPGMLPMGVRGEGGIGVYALGTGSTPIGLVACSVGCGVVSSGAYNIAAWIGTQGPGSHGLVVDASGGDAVGAEIFGSSSALVAKSGGDSIVTSTAAAGKSGIYAEHTGSEQGWAGYFQGDVTVIGTLSKSAGSFKIDHPLDPAHKYLQHSFVESPDMKDVYDGVVVTDRRGFATVRLPRWFQALNRTFRYQLTIVGTRGWNARVVREIARNRFTIQSDAPRVKVSWQVTGIRHDRYANTHRIPVEAAKRAADQGKFLQPELYGKPRTALIGYRKR